MTYAEVAEALQAAHPDVESGQMFGMPTLKARGKALAGEFKGSMVFKLTDSKAGEKALDLPGAKLFDPMGGRPMKQWVVVPAEQSEEWSELAEAAYKGLTDARVN